MSTSDRKSKITMAYIRWSRFSQLLDCKIYCWSNSIKLAFPSATPPLPYGVDMNLCKDSPLFPWPACSPPSHGFTQKTFGHTLQNFLYLCFRNLIPNENKEIYVISGGSPSMVWIWKVYILGWVDISAIWRSKMCLCLSLTWIHEKIDIYLIGNVSVVVNDQKIFNKYHSHERKIYAKSEPQECTCL